MKDLGTKLGKVVKDLRKENKMTQKELLSRSGIGWATLQRLEKDGIIPRPLNLHYIAQVFEMKLWELIKLAEEMSELYTAAKALELSKVKRVYCQNYVQYTFDEDKKIWKTYEGLREVLSECNSVFFSTDNFQPVELLEPQVTSKQVAQLQLMRHEGYRQKPYRDTMGILTIGYGWNLEANGLPVHMIEELLHIAIKDAEVIAKQFAAEAWPNLSVERQAVLINMAYNLGNRLMKFYTFRIALRSGNHVYAARRMRSSLWYKQVKGRGEELAMQMETGEIA
jgi:lysozyme